MKCEVLHKIKQVRRGVKKKEGEEKYDFKSFYFFFTAFHLTCAQ